jgi:hypothetical protein
MAISESPNEVIISSRPSRKQKKKLHASHGKQKAKRINDRPSKRKAEEMRLIEKGRGYELLREREREREMKGERGAEQELAKRPLENRRARQANTPPYSDASTAEKGQKRPIAVQDGGIDYWKRLRLFL